ncbi:hypothetical protein Kpho02_67860 [Kitasatospora phosalacinea]|uniref:Uncharacterized protein n=1 Tax=Kitasatospora phosalacinea TaxID=2065 RepID=A0A9W6QGE6_9ACTN|nr:hypothetical protein [Kitasatospora phosalacinea]GLW74488.1 hypothetical protein Kpho02_67860 [Kitasatospora phosalacinea]
MTDDFQPATGKTPPPAARAAVAYLDADLDVTSADLALRWCRLRASAEGWTLTRVITDPDPVHTADAEREGWREVVRLAASGALAGVITVNRSTLARCATDWDRVVAELAAHGTRLTTVRAHDLPVPAPGSL